jgi:hypothetical protein
MSRAKQVYNQDATRATVPIMRQTERIYPHRGRYIEKLIQKNAQHYQKHTEKLNQKNTQHFQKHTEKRTKRRKLNRIGNIETLIRPKLPNGLGYGAKLILTKSLGVENPTGKGTQVEYGK